MAPTVLQYAASVDGIFGALRTENTTEKNVSLCKLYISAAGSNFVASDLVNIRVLNPQWASNLVLN
jgi:hypothetical protein